MTDAPDLSPLDPDLNPPMLGGWAAFPTSQSDLLLLLNGCITLFGLAEAWKPGDPPLTGKRVLELVTGEVARLRDVLFRLKTECEIEGLQTHAGFDCWVGLANEVLESSDRHASAWEVARRETGVVVPFGPTTLVSALARASEAERQRDEALTEHTDMMWQRRRAEERAEALEARVRVLEEALRPFAIAAVAREPIDKNRENNIACFSGLCAPLVGDFRRARAALAEGERDGT